jgi:hypothetical protein
MWAALIFIYASAIILVAAFIFVAIDWLEPNRLLATVFKMAIPAAGAAAIANGLLANIDMGR